MIALDASVLIAFLDDTDLHHESALTILSSADAYAMHSINVAEVLVRWVREGRLEEAEATVAEIGVRHDHGFPRESAHLATLRSSTALKLPDCCSILVAEAGGWPMATFDERLARVARERGIEVLGVDV